MTNTNIEIRQRDIENKGWEFFNTHYLGHPRAEFFAVKNGQKIWASNKANLVHFIESEELKTQKIFA